MKNEKSMLNSRGVLIGLQDKRVGILAENNCQVEAKKCNTCGQDLNPIKRNDRI
jgi:hypothetical protein